MQISEVKWSGAAHKTAQLCCTPVDNKLAFWVIWGSKTWVIWGSETGRNLWISAYISRYKIMSSSTRSNNMDQLSDPIALFCLNSQSKSCVLVHWTNWTNWTWSHVTNMLFYSPTFGSPTIPIFKLVLKRPSRGLSFSSSFFFGGILVVCFLIKGRSEPSLQVFKERICFHNVCVLRLYDGLLDRLRLLWRSDWLNYSRRISFQKIAQAIAIAIAIASPALLAAIAKQATFGRGITVGFILSTHAHAQWRIYSSKLAFHQSPARAKQL